MKKKILIIIGAFVFAIISAYLLFKVNGNSLETYYTKEDYLVYLNKLKNDQEVHSKLLIFPNMDYHKIEELKYFKEDNIFDDNYFFYLVVHYQDNEFEIERTRLSNLSYSTKTKVKKPLYAPYGFKYPAYVSIYDGFDTYEYALINEEEKKIIYLFNQQFFFEDLGIREEYSPYNYVVGIDLRDENCLGYNMYQ